MTSEYCHKDAPEDLQAAVRDTQQLRKWVKPPRTLKDLNDALDYIHFEGGNDFRRGIVHQEISNRRDQEMLSRLAEIKNQNDAGGVLNAKTLLWTKVAAWAAVLGALAAFFSLIK